MTNPTDTNQASELYELCKEVYKRTRWEDTLQFYDSFKDIYSEGEYEDYGMSHSFIKGSYDIEDGQVPLYTSDYLLEKLPEWTELKRKTTISYTAKRDALESYSFESDTPLKALLKLTIALSKAGELK